MSHRAEGRRDDDEMHHCVVTLTGSQLDSKVRALLLTTSRRTEGFPMCGGHASSSVPDVRNQPTRVLELRNSLRSANRFTWPAHQRRVV